MKHKNVKLSPRLQRVWHAIASGKPGKQAAEELGLTYASFRTYTRELYLKLGVHSQVEAVNRLTGRP